jgi:hypothetical protein
MPDSAKVFAYHVEASDDSYRVGGQSSDEDQNPEKRPDTISLLSPVQ